MRIQVNDIFASDGRFFQVIKATAKTVTVCEIESKRTRSEWQTAHQGTTFFQPVRDSFVSEPMRRVVKWFDKNRPQINVNSYEDAFYCNNELSTVEHYD